MIEIALSLSVISYPLFYRVLWRFYKQPVPDSNLILMLNKVKLM